MRKCPNPDCGEENAPNATYCAYCGYDLPKTTPELIRPSSAPTVPQHPNPTPTPTSVSEPAQRETLFPPSSFASAPEPAQPFPPHTPYPSENSRESSKSSKTLGLAVALGVITVLAVVAFGFIGNSHPSEEVEVGNQSSDAISISNSKPTPTGMEASNSLQSGDATPVPSVSNSLNATARNTKSNKTSDGSVAVEAPHILSLAIKGLEKVGGKWRVTVNWRTENATRIEIDAGDHQYRADPKLESKTVSAGEDWDGEVTLFASNKEGKEISSSATVVLPTPEPTSEEDSDSSASENGATEEDTNSAGSNEQPIRNKEQDQTGTFSDRLVQNDVDTVASYSGVFDYADFYRRTPTDKASQYFYNAFHSASKQQLAIYRNSIFARFGLSFTKAPFDTVFAGRPWYKATIESTTNNQVMIFQDLMNAQQRKNVNFIKSLEKQVKQSPQSSSDTFDPVRHQQSNE